MTHTTDEASGLDRDNGEEPEPKKDSREILQDQILEALKTMRESSTGIFLSSLAAGLEIGFSLFLMAVMLTEARGHLPEPVIGLLVANMYAVGFVFVILGRAELFTEQTTLAVLPVLNGKASVGTLARLWGIVYVGNLIGVCAFAFLTVRIGPELGVIEPWAFGEIAHRMVGHAGTTIFLSGLLAGWLMGLLSWLVAASRDTISQIVVVWMITMAIGFAGLHHVVAGSVEVLAGIFSGRDVSATDFGRFLLWATLGNALGGAVFVGVIKYGYAMRRRTFS